MTDRSSLKEKFGDEGLLRIWELELVISGAVIVALFQIPQLIDRLYEGLALHLSNEIHMLPFMFYYIGKLILYPLIMTFMLHFFLRGFWVGLIGLKSVFPDGVKWEKLKLPPLQERFLKEESRDLDGVMDLVDRLSSTLFSILFLLVITFLWMGALFLCCVPIAMAINSQFGSEWKFNWILIGTFYAMLIIIFSGSGLGTIYDKHLQKHPEKLGKHPKLEAAVSFLYRFANVMSLSFINVPIITTFRSNLKKGTAIAGFFFLLIFFPAIFLTSFLLSKGILNFDSYHFFPNQKSEWEVRSIHYDNLREHHELLDVPSIQSDIIEASFVKLFIPFQVHKDNRLIEEYCPDLKAYRNEGFSWATTYEAEEHNDELITCIRDIYQVELNGTPLNDVRFLLYTHPKSKVRGILGYIPIERAQPGQNLLHIQKKTTTASREEAQESPSEQRRLKGKTNWYIPFWATGEQQGMAPHLEMQPD